MFTPSAAEPVPPMVSTMGLWAHTHLPKLYDGAPSSATWEAVNRVVYQPLYVPTTCVARRVWWANGATTTGAANVSVAIYAATSSGEPGTKLIECAATTQGTASNVQFVDITDTTLPPGTYWLALASSSVTNTTFFRWSISTSYDAALRTEQDSITVGSLPATATPVESTTANLWLFGFATIASP